MATAKEVLAVGEALAGENEAVVGQNNTTVNKYYGWPGAAYCGGLVKYCMEKAGCDLLKGCSNPWLISTLRKFMDAKGWRVTTPQAGDVFIDGDDQHGGYVDEVLGNGYFLTIEGNYGRVYATKEQAKSGVGVTFEGIGYRKASVSGNFKFYRPPYDGAVSGGSTPSGEAASGSTGISDAERIGKTKEWQTFLGVKADGTYGPDTRDAAIWKAVLAIISKNALRQGTSGDLVKIIQGRLYSMGYDPKGLDGAYGAGTAAAVWEFQKAHNLTADGVFGKDSFSAMFEVV